MSFVLGIYDLTAWLLPGFMYLFLINEFLQSLGFRHITISDLDQGLAWIGLAIAAFMLGFLALAMLDQFWFNNHWPDSEDPFERVVQRYPQLQIDFKRDDWTLLYPILKERIGSNLSLEHAERFNAFGMMSRNLFGVFSLGALLQLIKLISQGFNLNLFLLAVFFLVLAVIAYRTFLYYWSRCLNRLVGHVLAYGNNLETFLANDQPRWNPPGKSPER